MNLEKLSDHGRSWKLCRCLKRGHHVIILLQVISDCLALVEKSVSVAMAGHKRLRADIGRCAGSPVTSRKGDNAHYLYTKRLDLRVRDIKSS